MEQLGGGRFGQKVFQYAGPILLGRFRTIAPHGPRMSSVYDQFVAESSSADDPHPAPNLRESEYDPDERVAMWRDYAVGQLPGNLE